MDSKSLCVAFLCACLAACATAPVPDRRAEDTPASRTVPVEALNPDVRQSTIQETICVAGYASSVRPAASFTNGIKLKLLAAKGLPNSAAPDFELDHRVALAVGGHPRNPSNLQLQPWDGPAGAKEKDRLERRLQRMVCAGELRLDDAQRRLYFWPEFER